MFLKYNKNIIIRPFDPKLRRVTGTMVKLKNTCKVRKRTLHIILNIIIK